MIVYSNKRFLVVDDFSDFRSSVKAMLTQMGAQHIDVAASGAEAIALCGKTRYDIILHDYNLGDGKNGQQVLEELHQRKLIGPHCIFVMVTAESSQAMVMAALEYEPDAYLTKPFNRASLQQRLDRLVERKQVLAPILDALAAGNQAGVLAACDTLLATQPRLAPLCQRYRANALAALGRDAELETLLQAIIDERPLPWALVMLAGHLLERGHLDRAEALYEEGISQFPMLPTLYDGLARAKQLRGEQLKAQVFLEQAVKISPNNPQRQAELGRLARANQDPDRAVRAFRQAVNLGRHSAFRDPEHHLSLADSLCAQAGDSAPGPKVLLEIRQTMDDLNNSWRDNDALAARGELLQATALQRAGKTADAAQMAKSAAERLANMEDFFAADTALQVAAQLRALGQAAQADQVLSSCAEIYGDDPKVMAGIAEQTSDPDILRGGDQAMELNRQGMQLYQGKQFPQALEAFRNALALQPRNISYALNTAQSLLRLLLSAPDPALREECLDCLQRVRNMPPGDPRFERYNKLREKAESL